MYNLFFSKILYFLIVAISWPQGSSDTNESDAISVEIRKEGGKFQLYRGGEPYYIKGAGGEQHLDLLVSIGGNSIRRWGTDENTMDLLDRAHEKGISVCLGLNMDKERHGFDYDDKEAVAKQHEEIRQEVLKYKDHPAVLIWGIGNELDLRYTNTNMWHAVNDVSKMIHELDPHHLTTTMTAGITQEKVNEIKEKCQDLDLLAVNTYGGLPSLSDNLKKFGWNKAYIVTEWGPTGHWEVPRTEWGVAIEETTTEKAKAYKERYEASMKKDAKKCVGSYVFLWGQKQERTHTWYGLFMENGEPTEVVDVMQYNWTGKWPKTRAPHIDSIRLDGKSALQNVYLNPGKQYRAQVFAEDVDFNKTQVEWEIYHESTDLKEGGDREQKPDLLKDLFTQGNRPILQFNAPEKEGAYRVFVYLKDEKIDRVATANIPFFVKK